MHSSSRVGILCMLASLLVMVHGHGRLWDPPARTTAWRKGIPGAHVDYNDNQLYCGGKQVQWDQNNGDCGVCGDNARATVKPHEFGPQGLLTNFIIVETYKTGQVIDVTVDITANHRGYFEFRLCVRDDHLTTPLTHECLNQHILRVVRPQSTQGTRRAIGTKTGFYTTSLQLPSGVTCKECVLQWKYNTGNDWGICPDGVGRKGCSPTPEQFYGCADISITDDGGSSGGNNGNGGLRPSGNGNNGAGRPTPTTTTTTTTTSTTTSPTTTTGSDANVNANGDTTTTTTTTTTGSNANRGSASGCRGEGLYARVPGMRRWCLNNCNRGYCPSSHCSPKCLNIPPPVSSECEPTFVFRNNPGMRNWCKNNCPRYCPNDVCNDACREP